MRQRQPIGILMPPVLNSGGELGMGILRRHTRRLRRYAHRFMHPYPRRLRRFSRRYAPWFLRR
jgi:hypothetical protein